METYTYKILCEKDYATPGSPELDIDKFQRDLERFGSEGFRFIETIYNSDGTWIVMLSCPNNFPVARANNFGTTGLPNRYSNKRPRNEGLNRY
jgi:hypothetical protein